MVKRLQCLSREFDYPGLGRPVRVVSQSGVRGAAAIRSVDCRQVARSALLAETHCESAPKTNGRAPQRINLSTNWERAGQCRLRAHLIPPAFREQAIAN